jgi:hypothetical protein
MEHIEQIKKVIGANVQWLASLVKWLLVIIAAAIAFYCVYPKYYFPSEPLEYYSLNSQLSVVRCNRITGKVEIYENGKWTSLKPEADNWVDITPQEAFRLMESRKKIPPEP